MDMRNGNEIDFEFISTPFNEEITPIKFAKLEKYAIASIQKEPMMPPTVKPTPTAYMPAPWEMAKFFPFHTKNMMAFPQDPKTLIYRGDKPGPKNMLLMEMQPRNMNMMNMLLPPVFISKPNFSDLTEM